MKNAKKIAASLACKVTQQNPNNENRKLSIIAKSPYILGAASIMNVLSEVLIDLNCY